MRFWDSSAIIPLLLKEPSSSRMNELFKLDAAMVAWWGTRVECQSAIVRRERAGELDAEDSGRAIDALRTLAQSWAEVAPTERVREVAQRLVRVHDLRAAHAFQLAAAVVAAEGRNDLLPLVTLDERLAETAAREAFRRVR